MRVLVLGGTSWLGGTIASCAVAAGHQVTCLARGVSGSVPAGTRLVPADRWAPGAYDAVRGDDWDVVVEVSWQPTLVRSALDAVGGGARHWVYVSSISVYADHQTEGGDESAATVPSWAGGTGTEASAEAYAEAKVSCETACTELRDSGSLLVARAGLIAGYGDRSDRFGYWPARVARAASSGGPMLVPSLATPVQLVDVVDLAWWLVASAAQGTSGTFDAVGEPHTLEDVLDACAEASLYRPELVQRSGAWLVERGVTPWAGEDSLPLWLPEEAHGMVRRTGRACRASGLAVRPLLETVADALRWELQCGLGRPRRAGLSAGREQDLLSA